MVLSTEWGKNVARKVLSKITSDIRRLEQFPTSGVNLEKLSMCQLIIVFYFQKKNIYFNILNLKMSE